MARDRIYPAGVQTFSDIIEQGMVYVDKFLILAHFDVFTLSLTKLSNITTNVSISDKGTASHRPLSPSIIGRRMKLGMTKMIPRSNIHSVARFASSIL